MILVDVLGIIAIIFIFLAYMILTPILEGKNNGKKGNFSVLDDMAKKIKDIVRWMNRQ